MGATARLREQLLGASDLSTQLDVLERALVAAWRGRAVHPAVAFAVGAFRVRPSVARIGVMTDVTGLSPKRFIDRFRTEVGVTPKRFCRLLRFQRVVTHAHGAAEIDWARIAVASGYRVAHRLGIPVRRRPDLRQRFQPLAIATACRLARHERVLALLRFAHGDVRRHRDDPCQAIRVRLGVEERERPTP